MQQMIKNRGQECVSNYSTQQVEIYYLYTLCRTILSPQFSSDGFIANSYLNELRNVSADTFNWHQHLTWRLNGIEHKGLDCVGEH